jgi:hypothetical protein
MRLASRSLLLNKLEPDLGSEIATLDREIVHAIESVVWPPGSADFAILAESGVKRGKGSGVGLIKKEFVDSVVDSGWIAERGLRFADGTVIGRFDAVKPLKGAEFNEGRGRTLNVHSGQFAVLEWETGNISSSHRSLNRMALGLLHGGILAGHLVLPTRKLYRYLTGRVGSLEELSPYFRIYRALNLPRGFLEVLAVEYDRTSSDPAAVPRIPKATDGRARQ